MSKAKHFIETLVPEHYDLFINVDRGQKLISGKSVITANAKEKTVMVHEKYMTIKSVTESGEAVDFSLDKASEGIKIQLGKTGPVKLTIEYTAPLTDNMMGIYPSYYTENGQRKQLIGTQFETTFARQAFPCVDEPEAKATFDLALKFDEKPGETVIANMPEDHEKDGWHYFQTTKRMSTYLIAFAFGDMQSKITHTKSGVEIGVFATKAHKAKELDFALNIAKQAIEFYEDFYQTKYPLPHSYQLALPDFSAGAMENWGLVTYREAYLLLDPDNASLSTKELNATVITHELAHQWFGDLVTMKWWDEIWLNESFANMMEYVAADAIHPEWHIWDMFQTSEAAMALSRDATDGVQAVHVPVEDPADIDSLFDAAIVYAKGSRMLVMVRALIGDEALRKGLKNYFAAHKYANATGEDLWSALGKASGMDIGSIMHDWLDQPGYPVVTAKVASDGHLKLSQKQFFIGTGVDRGRTWQIPLKANYGAPKLMKGTELDLGDYEQLRSSHQEPFQLNCGNQSHCIVKYDATLRDDLMNHAKVLDPISQMQLMQDERLLATGRQTSFANVIPMLPQFKDSQAAIVNNGLYTAATALKKFVAPKSAAETNLRAFYNELSADQLDRLGWLPKDGESNDDQLTRPYVLSAALYAHNHKAKQEAHALFDKYADQPVNLPAAIRYYVIANEVETNGSAQLITKLMSDYKTTADGSYKDDLSAAISRNISEPAMIKKLLGSFEDATVIKPQDLRGWFAGLLRNPAGQQAAWDWIRNEWGWLEKTVGGDMEFATYITVIAGVFRTEQRLAEFKAFFEPKLDTPGLGREIKMDTSIIASRVDLIKADGEAVNDAVKAQLK